MVAPLALPTACLRLRIVSTVSSHQYHNSWDEVLSFGGYGGEGGGGGGADIAAGVKL